MKAEGVTIDLFSRNFLKLDGKSVHLRRDKSSAVLASAALSQDYEVTRSALSTLLWGDSSDHHARASLRQTLHRLKAEIPSEVTDLIKFETNKVVLHLKRDDFIHLHWLDQLTNGKLPETLRSKPEIAGLFCESLRSISPDFDIFVLQEKSIYTEAMTLALNDILNGADRDEGISAAQVLVRLDETNELARRHLMRCFAEDGELARAIREFEELQRILDVDYDVEPSHQTIGLIAKIKMGQIEARSKKANSSDVSQQTQSPSGDAPTIRVRQPTASATHQVPTAVTAFCSDLVSVLVRFREWTIIEAIAGDTEAARFELSIESVDAVNNPVVVILLKEVESRRFIWSENLELNFEKWRSNHLSVVQNMATAIERSISRSRLSQLNNQFPSSPSSFDLWIYCRDLVNTWRPTHFDEAAKLMHEIAAIDPDFAPAHTELAALYNSRHLFQPGENVSAESLKEAALHAQIAVQLDPLDAKAQRVLGYSELMNRQFEQAHFHLTRAIELNAADPLTLVSAGLGLMFCGDKKGAISAVVSATKIRNDLPPFLMGYMVTLFVLAGRNKDAAISADIAPEGIPNIRGWQAIALWRLGEKTKAADAAAALARLMTELWQGDTPLDTSSLCHWFLHAFPVHDKLAHKLQVDDLRAALNYYDQQG